MPPYFLDASALVKYYILEPGSTWVRALVDARKPDDELPINPILISDASIAECAVALAVLCRVNRISRSAQNGAYRAFMGHIAVSRLRTVTLSTADFHLAASFTQRHPLKAYDAVQLAVALRQHHALSAVKQSLIFVCGDKTLLAAAEAEGLPTDNPFDHVSPQDTPGRASS